MNRARTTPPFKALPWTESEDLFGRLDRMEGMLAVLNDHAEREELATGVSFAIQEIRSMVDAAEQGGYYKRAP